MQTKYRSKFSGDIYFVKSIGKSLILNIYFHAHFEVSISLLILPTFIENIKFNTK